MAIHANLTDPELHEPKGVASAASGTVYVANGSGSGAWLPQGTGLIIDLTTGVTGLLPATNNGYQRYVSPDQVITSAGALTLAHGLPSTPLGLKCVLVCQIGEGGYNPGDIVDPSMAQGGGGSRGVSIVPDGTNLNIRYGSQVGSCFYLVHKTTGTNFNITNANWLARFIAWIV